MAPTLIADLGLPFALDMSKTPRLAVFDRPPSPQFFDMYRQTDTAMTPDRIDESTEEQL